MLVIVWLGSAVAQLPFTANKTVLGLGDSLWRSQFGQGQSHFMYSDFVCMHPQYFIACHDQSESGRSVFTLMTNHMGMFCTSEYGTTAGLTNVLTLVYCSGNAAGSFGSNGMFLYVDKILQAPISMYNQFGQFTNDWTLPTNGDFCVIGDVPAAGTSVDLTASNYSAGGAIAAFGRGYHYINTFSNVIGVWTSAAAQGHYFDPPAKNHHDRSLGLIQAETTLKSMGAETNAFTTIINFGAVSVSSTQHCTVTSLTTSGNGVAFTFHADRMKGGYYSKSDHQTNDCLPAFGLMPTLTNYACEIFRFTNCPAGNYNLVEDGEVVLQGVSSVNGEVVINHWSDVHTGALWRQKEAVLNYYNDMVNVDRTNASDLYQPNGNQLIIQKESNANITAWQTNKGTADWTASLQPFQNNIKQEDILINTAVQQTNHAFALVPVSSMTVTNGAVGNLIIGQVAPEPTLVRDPDDIYLWHIVFPTNTSGSNYVWAPETTSNAAVKFKRPAGWRWSNDTIYVAQQSSVTLLRVAGVTNTDP